MATEQSSKTYEVGFSTETMQHIFYISCPEETDATKFAHAVFHYYDTPEEWGAKRCITAIAAILAVCWLWVAWGFHWQRYASINLAAGYFAWAFAAQALLLLWLGAVRGRLTPAQATRFQQRAALGLLSFSLLVFPLIGPLLGRSWMQAEVFGMAPDPTALATLGVLLLAGPRPAWALFPIPVAWCLLSGTTLWAMESPDFAVVPLAALLAVLLAVGGALMNAWPKRSSR